MDVTFVCSSGEAPFKMEVGFFDTVQDIKQKLRGCKGWPVATLSRSQARHMLMNIHTGNTGLGHLQSFSPHADFWR